MFNILMPSWNVWSGRALTPKFDFRDDPSIALEVRPGLLLQMCTKPFRKGAEIFSIHGGERKFYHAKSAYC